MIIWRLKKNASCNRADDSTIGVDLVSAEMFLEELGCMCQKPNDADVLCFCVFCFC